MTLEEARAVLDLPDEERVVEYRPLGGGPGRERGLLVSAGTPFCFVRYWRGGQFQQTAQATPLETLHLV